MGHAVEEAARRRGHEIVAIIDADNQQEFDSEAFASADVAIEFTTASQALENMMKAWRHGLPIVSGTTGRELAEKLSEIRPHASEKGYTLLHSSNFSIGVNLLFALNRYLAKLIGEYDYHASIEETHHIHKLDHPSGTAITLADQILNADPRYKSWKEVESDEKTDRSVLPIRCIREGENPGFHEISWNSEADCIRLTHQAYNRSGFALGAVLGAEWLVKQPRGRFYSIDDMFMFHS